MNQATSESSQVENLASFFEKFSSTSSNLHNKYLQVEKEELSTFFGKSQEVFAIHQQKLKQHAPYFNLFYILKISHLEARVHTPILVNLLNPNGSHSQGSFFLERFFRQLHIFHGLWDQIRWTDVEVYEEYATGSKGNIDILLRYRSHENSFAVVIENKIFAHDQERQLERYFDYCCENLRLKNDRILLFYLKPENSRPTEHSIHPDRLKSLEDAGCIQLISYKEEIVHWLESCLAHLEPPALRETLYQYLTVIKRL